MSRPGIVPAEAVPAAEILGAIAKAFDRPLTMEWFRWKHRDGPWGPSWGRVAVDPDTGSVVGVRLVLPWRLRLPSGDTVVVHRAVEAATVPRARGAGVFSRLNRAIMEELAGAGCWNALLSTPNGQSRGGYRKLGWTPLGPLAHEYSPVRWRRSAVVDHDLCDGPDVSSSRRLRTDWDAAALRWRTDPRSGRRYRTVALREGNGAGISYRVLRHAGANVLLPLVCWGDPREGAVLLGAVARRERAPVVLRPVGPGTPRPYRRVGLHRGGSLVTVWETNTSDAIAGGPIGDVGRWELDMVDLESVL